MGRASAGVFGPVEPILDPYDSLQISSSIKVGKSPLKPLGPLYANNATYGAQEPQRSAARHWPSRFPHRNVEGSDQEGKLSLGLVQNPDS